jgi:FHA domain
LSRFRLRFHLQEVDLRVGMTTLGRSEDCEVTIEDPLVSRRHAQIIVDGDEVSVVDLGSRNGVRVNGLPVTSTAILRDGDRIRIGTQDLVFTRVELKVPSHSPRRTTGVLRLCARCKLPFARETPSCPHCGASEQTDEDTLSGSFGNESQHSWSVQLLLEAVAKAIGLERFADADRMLRRATGLFEDRLVQGGRVEEEQVERAALAAVRVCDETKDPTWGTWIPKFYARAALYPPAVVSDKLADLALAQPALAEALAALAVDMAAMTVPSSGSPKDKQAFARLWKA